VARQDVLGRIRRVSPARADLVDLHGNDPGVMLEQGLKAMGGLGEFIKRGDRVVLKPNFARALPDISGATTSPEVVRKLVQRCFAAGAQEVVCLEHAMDRTPEALRINNAYQAVEGTGARLLCPWSAEQFVVLDDFSRGKLHRTKVGWQAVASVLLTCDALIDVPIFKHHQQTRVSGAVKNLMGCVWRRRAYHQADLHRCIAELCSVLRPTLVVTDVGRILLDKGPAGPGPTKQINHLLISADPVLADGYACRFLDIDPRSVSHLVRAGELGAGKLPARDTRIKKMEL